MKLCGEICGKMGAWNFERDTFHSCQKKKIVLFISISKKNLIYRGEKQLPKLTHETSLQKVQLHLFITKSTNKKCETIKLGDYLKNEILKWMTVFRKCMQNKVLKWMKNVIDNFSMKIHENRNFQVGEK